MTILTNNSETAEEVIEILLPPKKAVEYHYRELQQKKKSWTPISNCWTEDPSTMYPRSHNQELGVASTVCAYCPAMEECLYLSLVKREEYGVWGGHSAKQIQKALSEIEEEYGDIWIHWNEKSSSIILNKAHQMMQEYNTKFNIDNTKLAMIRAEREETLYQRLVELRL